MQVAPYDPRHIVQTICHAHRHEGSQAIELHVYEDNAAVLLRHLLLVAVLLDEALPAATRMQRFLEIFGNALLRQDTADYLAARCRDVEAVLERMMAGHASDTVLGRLLNIGSLSFEERDGLMDAAMGARTGRDYDMTKAWDARCRSWYADRYDFRRNAVRAPPPLRALPRACCAARNARFLLDQGVASHARYIDTIARKSALCLHPANYLASCAQVDWDYHMRLAPLGTPCTDAKGSIIHFYHFRHWRLTGIAYEVRSSAYTAPNWTLLSTATGRTREFKDRCAPALWPRCGRARSSSMQRTMWPTGSTENTESNVSAPPLQERAEPWPLCLRKGTLVRRPLQPLPQLRHALRRRRLLRAGQPRVQVHGRRRVRAQRARRAARAADGRGVR